MMIVKKSDVIRISANSILSISGIHRHLSAFGCVHTPVGQKDHDPTRQKGGCGRPDRYRRFGNRGCRSRIRKELVRVGNDIWKVRPADGTPKISVGCRVRVVNVEGIHLIVEEHRHELFHAEKGGE